MSFSPTLRKLALACLALALIGMVAWWLTRPSGDANQQRYVTVQAEQGLLRQTVSANGTLNPVTLVNVGSQVSGIVKAIHADFNDHVSAGQVLLELDPTLNEAQAAQSAATLESARASLDLAVTNEARMRDLHAKEFATRLELDTAVQALKAAKAQVKLAEAQALRDRTNLGYTQIRSPVSGVVVSRQIDVGQTVAASFQAPVLFQIAQDLSRMQINSSFAEADIGNIRADQVADFTVDAFPGRTFHGKVRQVRMNPTTVQNVVTYNVVIDVDNPEHLLLPGMTAYVSVTTASREGVLKVPNAALRFHPEGNGEKKRESPRKEAQPLPPSAVRGRVFVLDGATLKPVPLVLGISDGNYTEVLSGGLAPNAKLVTEDRQAASGSKNRPTSIRL